MKQKILIGFLCAEAAACMLYHLLQASYAELFTSALAFPFEQIGWGLRFLSLSGTVGNVAAIAVYAAVCLIPAATLLLLWKKRKLYAEDALLCLLSAVLFAVIYFMINPGVIGSALAGQPVIKAVLGGVAYSVLCGYIILRMVHLFSAGGTDKLIRYMRIMLGLLCVLFVYMVFGSCFDSLLGSIKSLQAGNAGNEDLLGVSYAFLVLQYIADAAPYALNVFVVFSALRLLSEMRVDRYSAAALSAATQMTHLCGAALVATVLLNICFNVLQLLFVKSLMVINTSVQIPVIPIAFVLAALILTRLAAENKQLKDDNDMFI